MKTFEPLFEAMREAADPRSQKNLATYFATDFAASRPKSQFPGLTAVAARRVALRFAKEFGPSDIRQLLASRVPEHRFAALEMLVRKYETGTPSEREEIANLYLRNLRHIDHWVLVDTSAPYVLARTY